MVDAEEAFGCEQRKCDGDAALYGVESVEREEQKEWRPRTLSELIRGER